MTSTKKCISAALTAAVLTIGLTISVMASEMPNEPVRVSSYKGGTLEVPAAQTTLSPPAPQTQ